MVSSVSKVLTSTCTLGIYTWKMAQYNVPGPQAPIWAYLSCSCTAHCHSLVITENVYIVSCHIGVKRMYPTQSDFLVSSVESVAAQNSHGTRTFTYKEMYIDCIYTAHPCTVHCKYIKANPWINNIIMYGYTRACSIQQWDRTSLTVRGTLRPFIQNKYFQLKRINRAPGCSWTRITC